MHHHIKIDVDRFGYDWIVDAHCNGVVMTDDGECIASDLELREKNHIIIYFSNKDPTRSPDMISKITKMTVDYIDVTPLLYQAVYYTAHPDYPRMNPCLDINLNGAWHLEFGKDFMAHTLKGYLGL